MIILQIFWMARTVKEFDLIYERDKYEAKAENEKNDNAIRFRNDMYEAHNLPQRDYAVEVPR